ncbi:hypothetical protein EBR96_03725 [bacterium]|nr:hypothetical protein [bacterium]
MISYDNGRYVDTESIAFSAFDDAAGSIRGYRVFTVGRTVNGVVFRLDAHVRRMFDSASRIAMDVDFTPEFLIETVNDLVARNRAVSPNAEMLAEIIFTGGPVRPGGIAPSGSARLIVMILPLTVSDPTWYSKGIALASFEHQRPFPSVKLTFYVGGVIAQQTVCKTHNALMPLFITESKPHYVLEAATANFFAVRNGQLFTPDLNGKVLPGITRDTVIECARNGGLQVNEQPLPFEVTAWDEAFITSSTRGVVPVTRINDIAVGNGTVGEVTRATGELYNRRLIGQ